MIAARAFLLTVLCSTPAWLWPGPVPAVTMVNDPQGFGGIAWGSAFRESEEYVLAESSPRIKGYELKQGPPPLGEARIDAMRLLTIDGKFARVMVRYQGTQTHAKVLAYLEAKYGPLDRTPGQLSVGTLVLHNWRGPETEVNLTFDVKRERGVIFIESRTLMPVFQDAVSDTVN
jgi:hypothetical protein